MVKRRSSKSVRVKKTPRPRVKLSPQVHHEQQLVGALRTYAAAYGRGPMILNVMKQTLGKAISAQDLALLAQPLSKAERLKLARSILHPITGPILIELSCGLTHNELMDLLSKQAGDIGSPGHKDTVNTVREWLMEHGGMGETPRPQVTMQDVQRFIESDLGNSPMGHMLNLLKWYGERFKGTPPSDKVAKLVECHYQNQGKEPPQTPPPSPADLGTPHSIEARLKGVRHNLKAVDMRNGQSALEALSICIVDIIDLLIEKELTRKSNIRFVDGSNALLVKNLEKIANDPMLHRGGQIDRMLQAFLERLKTTP
jgi:hypothetical protein